MGLQMSVLCIFEDSSSIGASKLTLELLQVSRHTPQAQAAEALSP